MYLFRDVMDKGIVDCHGDKMGKVDDLLLEVRPDGAPAVKALVVGHGALFPILPNSIASAGRWMQEKLLGLTEIKPIVIDWDHVTSIDVVVHLDVDRLQIGETQTEEALWKRWVSSLPWSRR